jgi:hypothetical protein
VLGVRQYHSRASKTRGPPMSALDDVALMLSAAGDATDQVIRVLYLAHARALLSSVSVRHRELSLLLAAMEGDVVAAQLEIGT